MIAILVFANRGKPQTATGFWYLVYEYKWFITALRALGLTIFLGFWFKMSWLRLGLAAALVILLHIFSPFDPVLLFAVGSLGLAIVTATDKGESREWFGATWGFAGNVLESWFYSAVHISFTLLFFDRLFIFSSRLSFPLILIITIFIVNHKKNYCSFDIF